MDVSWAHEGNGFTALFEALAERRTQALLQARREVVLIQPGTVEILATALVQPSQDPEDIKARDIEVERIAMEGAVRRVQARGR